MSSTYDFVVLGGGHNGLITTAYLAKAGFSVCCLEANDEFGGSPAQAKCAHRDTSPTSAAWFTT